MVWFAAGPRLGALEVVIVYIPPAKSANRTKEPAPNPVVLIPALIAEGGNIWFAAVYSEIVVLPSAATAKASDSRARIV
jgi:hypothetical protein